MPASTDTVKHPAPRKRNAFLRTNVPWIERVISILAVTLLAGIGVAVWLKGKQYDPNLYSLRTDALKSTAASVEGKAGTLRSQEPAQAGGESAGKPAAAPSGSATTPASESEPAAKTTEAGEGHDGEGAAVARSPAAKGEPLEIKLAGIKPMSDTEFYSPDNLFEKIDGRAPAYLGFNFQQLRCRSFAVEGGASYVDVYEYRMDTPVNAFGIFSIERDPKGKPLDFAPDGYSGDMGFYFRQGACYVQVIASDTNPKTVGTAKAIAEDRAKSIPPDNVGLDARRRLPNTGLMPETVTFVQENAQGQAFLKNVFQAKYDFEGVKLPFFLMVTEPQTAEEAWKSFLSFSGRFGKVVTLPDVAGAKIFQAEAFGSVKVIYRREGEMGGVFDARDAGKASGFVEKYLKGEIR